MEAVVNLHLSAAVTDDKHNVVLMHQVPLKPVCQQTETGSVHWHRLPGCWQFARWGPSKLVDFISNVKVNISKPTRDHTLSPQIASSIALGWTDLSPQQAFQ